MFNHRGNHQPVDFAREILPILSNKCFACHGPGTKKAKDLRLDGYAAAIMERKGTRAIDPEAPETSELLLRIHDKEDPMPPGDTEKLLTEPLHHQRSTKSSSFGQRTTFIFNSGKGLRLPSSD